MKKIISGFFLLLVIILSVACTSTTIQTLEVTRLVPQTILVTDIITPIPPISTSKTLEPENEVYFEGIIVIVEYYKLLDQSRYEEAYQLLGAQAKTHSPNLEDYVASSRIAFKDVKIVTIQPYDEWASQQGYQPSLDPKMREVFFVQIIAKGIGVNSGSAISGEVQTLFITVTQEEGQWRIASFSTGIRI
jgi:hypothetical protein